MHVHRLLYLCCTYNVHTIKCCTYQIVAYEFGRCKVDKIGPVTVYFQPCNAHSADREQGGVNALWDFNQDTHTILRPTKPTTHNGTAVSIHHGSSNGTVEQTPETATEKPGDTPLLTEDTPTTTQLGIEEMVMGQPDSERSSSFVSDGDSPIKRARDSVISRPERPLVRSVLKSACPHF